MTLKTSILAHLRLVEGAMHRNGAVFRSEKDERQLAPATAAFLARSQKRLDSSVDLVRRLNLSILCLQHKESRIQQSKLFSDQDLQKSGQHIVT